MARKRDAEEADKVEVALAVTVASLRRFRAALIGSTEGLPKRRITVTIENSETLILEFQGSSRGSRRIKK